MRDHGTFEIRAGGLNRTFARRLLKYAERDFDVRLTVDEDRGLLNSVFFVTVEGEAGEVDAACNWVRANVEQR